MEESKSTKWYGANLEKGREHNRKSYRKHREQRLHQQKEQRAANPTLSRMRNNRRNLELKVETLTHYGPSHTLQCCEMGCPVSDVDMLTLDHVSDDGAQHRRLIGSRGGASTYRFLAKNGYPEGYQTLCWNHQAKKALTKARNGRKDGFNEDLH